MATPHIFHLTDMMIDSRDSDHFNFNYVTQGVKRITFVDPNLHNTTLPKGKHCSDEFQRTAGACWYDVDIFEADHIPKSSVTLRAGEGIIIPSRHPHAVENLEDTISVSISGCDCSKVTIGCDVCGNDIHKVTNAKKEAKFGIKFAIFIALQ